MSPCVIVHQKYFTLSGLQHTVSVILDSFVLALWKSSCQTFQSVSLSSVFSLNTGRIWRFSINDSEQYIQIKFWLSTKSKRIHNILCSILCAKDCKVKQTIFSFSKECLEIPRFWIHQSISELHLHVSFLFFLGNNVFSVIQHTCCLLSNTFCEPSMVNATRQP